MRNNIQPIALNESKRDPAVLEIQEIFSTLQGEGPFAGVPAIFIRLAGCNLQCPFCDTDYTSKAVFLDLDEITTRINSVRGMDTRLVVVTGGEPFRQNLSELLPMLHNQFELVQIETNGTLFQEVPQRTVVICSPKTARIHPKLAQRANAFKYVVTAGDVDLIDGLPLHALNHPATRLYRPPADDSRTIYVQPIDVHDPVLNAVHLEAAVDSCLNYGYRLCLQLHKICGLA